jgi:hypothetical protein
LRDIDATNGFHTFFPLACFCNSFFFSKYHRHNIWPKHPYASNLLTTYNHQFIKNTRYNMLRRAQSSKYIHKPTRAQVHIFFIFPSRQQSYIHYIKSYKYNVIGTQHHFFGTGYSWYTYNFADFIALVCFSCSNRTSLFDSSYSIFSRLHYGRSRSS